jgi:hypothetical protein
MSVLQTLPSEGRTTADRADASWLSRGNSGMSRASRRAADPQARRAWESQVIEAMRLYTKVLAGSARAALDFKEAMTRSDFPLLFADVLDRQLLAAYAEWPASWPAIAKRGTVRDFRTVKRFTLDGGAVVLDKVGESTEYPEASLAEGKYEYAVEKYGRVIGISWETLIDDDLDAFRDLPKTLGKAGRMTEDRFVTSLYCSATGPNGTFYAVGNKNIVTGDPVLSVSGLQTAFTVLGSQVDVDGNPIYIDAVALEVPPALEVTARNIINATEILAADGGGAGSGNDQLRVANWMKSKVTLVVNPWLPIIDRVTGSTAWYLFASPTAGRPALEVGFLRGNESPALYVKAPDSLRVGGGLAPVEDGDFETDAIRHKVRHVLGGTLMDPKMSVASDGTAGAGS